MKKLYGFHYSLGKDREIINKGYFYSQEEATEYFSGIKKLSIKNFLKIYKVIEL